MTLTVTTEQENNNNNYNNNNNFQIWTNTSEIMPFILNIRLVFISEMSNIKKHLSK